MSVMFYTSADCYSVKQACQKLDITLILGERLDLESIEDGKAKVNEAGQKVVRTVTGREIAADLLVRRKTL